MSTASEPTPMGRIELTLVISAIMALTALGIDLLLPAFDELRDAFGLAEGSNEIARSITVFFLGLALGQLFYGPFTDRFGRKPVLAVGLAIYLIGAAASALAPSLGWLFAARFVWGVGAAGTRVIALSIVRDTYEGEEMAQAMSYIMAVFILVPIVAPSLGAAVLAVASWEWVFWSCAALAVVVWLWSRRLDETLAEEHRQPLDVGRIGLALKRVATTRLTAGYTLAQTFLLGAFTSYLASSELLVDEVFGRKDQFPVIFGAVAVVLGAASFLNARIVRHLGMRATISAALVGYVTGSIVLLALALAADGRPGFWAFYSVLALTGGCYMLMVPNMNAIAMGPVGDIAGTAAAAIGSVSMGLGALLGSVVDANTTDTVTPLAVAFLLAGLTAGVTMWSTERLGLRRSEQVPAG